MGWTQKNGRFVPLDRRGKRQLAELRAAASASTRGASTAATEVAAGVGVA
jgi:hypothetical protein